MAACLRFRAYSTVITRSAINGLKLQKLYVKPCIHLQCNGSLISSSSVRYLSALNEIQEKEDHIISKKRNTGPRSGIEHSLFQLDLDVRRTGRITKDEVLNLIKELKEFKTITSSQVLMLIRCCGAFIPDELPLERMKLVETVWETLIELDVSLDISHYNALLRAYLENSYKFSPSEFLSLLESKRIEPNRVTYQRLISRYCQDGDINGATKILEYMKQKDLPVSETIFNSLIVGHSKANDFANAKKVLDLMKNAGLEPVIESYSILMNCYADAGLVEEIEVILDELKSKEMNLSDKDYLDLIYHLSIGGKLEFIDEIIQRIMKQPGYNQDCINTIYELCNIGQDKIAFQLLGTMVSSVNVDGNNLQNSGNFFLRHLVKLGRPTKDIFEYCDSLRASGENLAGIFKVVEACYIFNKVDYLEDCMKKILSQGSDLRPHYFWPWLASQRHNPDDLLGVVKLMSDLDVSCNFETFKDYIAPYIDVMSDAYLTQLIQLGHSPGAVVNPFVCHLISMGKFSDALRLVSRHKVSFVQVFLKQSLLEGLNKNPQYSEFLKFLKKVIMTSEDKNMLSLPGLVLRNYLRSNCKQSIAESIISEYDKKKVPIAPYDDEIRSLLIKIMSPAIEESLSNLKDIQLQPSQSDDRRPSNMNVVDLETSLKNAKENGKPTLPILKQLFQQHLKKKNLPSCLKIKEELDAQGFVFSSGLQASLLGLHTQQGNLQEAMELFQSLSSSDPEFHLDNSKMIYLLGLLNDNGQLHTAIDLLEKYPTNAQIPSSMNVQGPCIRLLKSVCNTGDVQSLQKLHQLLRDKKIVEITPNTLRPLVQIHLDKGEDEKALAVFKLMVEEYKMTPCYSEMLRHFINIGDAENLQCLVDLGTLIHGEMNSIYNLFFALLEEGKISEAEKLLRTPGLRAKNDRLQYKCQVYSSTRKTELLEKLVAMTKDLFEIDRNMMYYHLLKTYCEEEDVEKALGVWVSLQEEDIQPSVDLLAHLGNFLRSKGQSVPFEIPENKASAPPEIQPPLRSLLLDKKLDEALKLKEKLLSENKTLPISEQSLLIDELVAAERLNEACKITMELFKKNVYPLPRTMRFLSGKLVQHNDYESLEQLGTYASQDVRKLISLDNKICSAYVNAGLGVKYLQKIISAADEDYEKFKLNFPSGGVVGLLEKENSALSIYTPFAEDQFSKGYSTPLNVLWIHYLTKGNFTEANTLFEKYLRNSNSMIRFKYILNVAKKSKNLIMANNCLDQIKTCPTITKSSLGLIHSTVIDILVQLEKYDDVNSQIKLAKQEGIPLSHSCLSRAKSAIEKAGGSFQYELSEKKPKLKDVESSDSSDSDSDKN